MAVVFSNTPMQSFAADFSAKRQAIPSQICAGNNVICNLSYPE